MCPLYVFLPKKTSTHEHKRCNKSSTTGLQAHDGRIQKGAVAIVHVLRQPLSQGSNEMCYGLSATRDSAAIFPNTVKSTMALPPRRLPPCTTPVISPAAYRPGMTSPAVLIRCQFPHRPWCGGQQGCGDRNRRGRSGSSRRRSPDPLHPLPRQWLHCMHPRWP